METPQKQTNKQTVFFAARKGHVWVVKVLLEHNVNPNQATATDGCTPV